MNTIPYNNIFEHSREHNEIQAHGMTYHTNTIAYNNIHDGTITCDGTLGIQPQKRKVHTHTAHAITHNTTQ